MTVLNTGSTKQYSDGWERIFEKKRKKSSASTSAKKSPAKKATPSAKKIGPKKAKKSAKK